MGRGMREFLSGLGWLVAVTGGVSLALVGFCGALGFTDGSLKTMGVLGGLLLAAGVVVIRLTPGNPPRPPDPDQED